MKVCLVGASGLVGSHLLDYLKKEDSIESILCLSRRDSFTMGKVQNRKIDFEKIAELDLSTIDVLFCCLGTTIKVAGSKEEFKKVDHDYVIELGKLAKKYSIPKFLVVSAMGVDSKSFLFYNQVKGQMEEALHSLELRSLQIFRPSLLLGERREFRLGEKIGEVVGGIFSFAFIGELKKFKPIEAKKVALSMLNHSLKNSDPFLIVESDEMND
jgi:uncharacterized protein YbjT (DUF2867 family)